MEQKQLLKLNLGCGNKFINGFTNVDVVKPQGKLPEGIPFVEDDIRSLDKFEDNTAEQIIAMHLVEHIPVYDLEAMLIRWRDVLAPGGCVIVEMPDIVKSCINTLQLFTTEDSQIAYNLGLKGLFGEPDPNNTFMEHKWGWTFKTLSQQFRNAGYVNVKEEVPVTHMGPVRDFRLVAFKEAEVQNEEATA